MAEQLNDFIWDYYGGRPFRRTYPGKVMRPVSWMRATALDCDTAQKPGVFSEIREAGRDMEYFQSMYPEKMRKLQREIQDVCDTVDYEGSILYDEYPDRVGLGRLCDEVYRKEAAEEMNEKEAEWLKSAIEVILYHEVCKRRLQRNTQRRRYW